MQRPPRARRSPVVAYATIIGLLVIAALFFSTQFGRTHESPKRVAPSASAPAAKSSP